MRKKSILIADDQREIVDILADRVKQNYNKVHIAYTGESAIEIVKKYRDEIELVILDLDFGVKKMDGMQVLKGIKAVNADISVVILTGNGTISKAVQAIKLGASDFIEKDYMIDEKVSLSLDKVHKINRIVSENRLLKTQKERLESENRALKQAAQARYRIVGQSKALTRILDHVRRISSIPRPVLITGERGTGKELIAALIHYEGDRKSRPFVKVNCGALQETLLESELFGHEKGAFTGASEQKIGKFETADGGTLLLDEIGNISPGFQKKILRVLEYQEFERVQGNKTIKVDVRVIAATNSDLTEEIKKGQFRPDLYDRLSFDVIHLPSLRDRKEDIALLSDYFIESFSKEVPSIFIKRLSAKALQKLNDYDWPGNVRELKNIIERAMTIADGDTIESEDIQVNADWTQTVQAQGSDGFEETVRKVEIRLLMNALQAKNWNQKDAAELLGLSYDKFRYYFRKYDLKGSK